jgi:hypothetical protein
MTLHLPDLHKESEKHTSNNFWQETTIPVRDADIHANRKLCISQFVFLTNAQSHKSNMSHYRLGPAPIHARSDRDSHAGTARCSAARRAIREEARWIAAQKSTAQSSQEISLVALPAQQEPRESAA